MGVNDIYYLDWQDPRSKWRYRLELIIRYSQPLLPGVSAPGWGEDEDAGTSYLRIANDAVSTPNLGESGYDGLMVGLQRTPTLTAGFRIDRLTNNLGLYLVDSRFTNGISVSVGGNSNYTLVTDSFNVARLLSDRGNPSLSVDDFFTEFIGLQQDTPGRTLSLRYSGTIYQEVQFVHAGRAVLEMIPPEMLSQHVFYTMDTTTFRANTGSNALNAKACYDVLYESSGDFYALCSSTRGTDEQRAYYALYREGTLARAIQELAEAVLNACLRQEATFTYDSPFAPASSSVGHSPIMGWKYYKQTYVHTNERGVEIANPEFNLYFVGAIWYDVGIEYNVGTDGLGERLDSNNPLPGGFFAPADPDGAYVYSNLFDLMTDYVRGCACKGQWGYTSSTGIVLHFTPVLDSKSGIVPTIQVNDVAGAVGAGVDVEVGANALRSAPVQFAGAEGDDSSPVEVVASGRSIAEQDFGITAWWSNIPTVGTEVTGGDWFFMDPSKATTINSDFTSADVYCLAYRRAFSRKIYYYTDGDDSGSSNITQGLVPLLPHPLCEVVAEEGGSAYGTTLNVAEEFPDSLPNPSKPDVQRIEDWLFLVRNVNFAHQTQACTANCVSSFMRAIFGNLRQFAIGCELEVEKTQMLDRVGEKFQLTDENDDPASLDIFVHGAPTMLSATYWPTYVWLLSVEVKDGLSTVQLLGVPD